MEDYRWFMGIDVSKSKLDITLLEGSEKRHYSVIENSEKSIKLFIKELTAIAGLLAGLVWRRRHGARRAVGNARFAAGFSWLAGGVFAVGWIYFVQIIRVVTTIVHAHQQGVT